MASYREVMGVLGKFYSLPEDVIQNQLRGRVQNFQKLGIPIGLQVGKGKRIDYGRNEIYQLVLCLELAELGLLPAFIAKIIKETWEKAYWQIIKGVLKGDKFMIYYKLNLMSAGWEKRELSFVEKFHLQEEEGECEEKKAQRRYVKKLDEFNNDMESRYGFEFSMVSVNDSFNPFSLRFRHMSVLNIQSIVEDIESHLVGIVPPYSSELE